MKITKRHLNTRSQNGQKSYAVPQPGVTTVGDDPYAIPRHAAETLKLDALRFLQMIYRDPSLSTAVRMRAAISALNYEVPRLAVTAQIREQDFPTLLDRRLKRIEEMKLIAADGAKVIDAKPQPVETKPPLARTPDRRFRRF